MFEFYQRAREEEDANRAAQETWNVICFIIHADESADKFTYQSWRKQIVWLEFAVDYRERYHKHHQNQLVGHSPLVDGEDVIRDAVDREKEDADGVDWNQSILLNKDSVAEPQWTG